MFRIALTSYLLLAVAIGPSFCCCTPIAVLNALASAIDATDAMPAHCPYHAAMARAEKPNQQKRDNQSPRDCPCKDQPTVVVASLEKPIDTNSRFEALAILNLDATASAIRAPGSVSAPGVFDNELLGKSGRDILRAYQRLLC